MLETPVCHYRECRHFRGVHQPDGTEVSEVNVCPAFPHGIPVRIAYGSDKHLTVAVDQEGETVYEERPL